MALFADLFLRLSQSNLCKGIKADIDGGSSAAFCCQLLGPFLFTMDSEPPLSALSTELPNPATSCIDRLSSLDLVTLINSQDAHVIECTRAVLPDIAHAIDELTPRLRKGGRVIYFGAGTSGRLGVLDASECIPTFSCNQFIGIIAGGDDAISKAKEDAEDSQSAGEVDLIRLQLDPEKDAVVGVAASGRTPYVLGGLRYAHSIGCLTIGVACTSPSAMTLAHFIGIMIAPISGPEVVAGSTRMKAGTATKLVLNMLSTGSMIFCGKTFGNLMVDMRVSNVKLKVRGRRLIRTVNTGGIYMPSSSVLDIEPSDDTLDSLIAQCDGSVKLAIVVGRTGWSVQRASMELEAQQGILARVLDMTTGLESTVSTSTEVFNLSVDGGGTSTKVVLSSTTGDILARGISGPSNVSTEGIDGCLTSVQSAITMALNTLTPPVPLARVRFGRAWVGHAGLDATLRPTIFHAYARKVEAFLGLQVDHDLKLTSDAHLLTASLLSTPQKQGVVLIAGTGSISMLFLRRDESDCLEIVSRAGGLGYLLGDEGSAYSIGRQAIKHVVSQSFPDKCLAEEVMGYLNVKSSRELLQLVYKDARSSKSIIASVAPLVLACAGRGNSCAGAILQEAVEDLTDMVLRVLPEIARIDIAVCVTGGITGSEEFRRAFMLLLGWKNAALAVNVHWVDDPALVACQSLVQWRR